MANRRLQCRHVFWRSGMSTASERAGRSPTGHRARIVAQQHWPARSVGARGGHEGPVALPGPHPTAESNCLRCGAAWPSCSANAARRRCSRPSTRCARASCAPTAGTWTSPRRSSSTTPPTSSRPCGSRSTSSISTRTRYPHAPSSGRSGSGRTRCSRPTASRRSRRSPRPGTATRRSSGATGNTRRSCAAATRSTSTTCCCAPCRC